MMNISIGLWTLMSHLQRRKDHHNCIFPKRHKVHLETVIKPVYKYYLYAGERIINAYK